MKELSIPTRLYLLLIYVLGALLISQDLLNLQVNEPLMLVILCILASLALIIKVEGATNRSHYSFSFIIYGFSFAYLGVPQTAIVILASSLVEFLVNRPPWFIQVFNASCYVIVINAAGFIFHLIEPGLVLTTPAGILAITASMATFTLLNHFIVGIIVWMQNVPRFFTACPPRFNERIEGGLPGGVVLNFVPNK